MSLSHDAAAILRALQLISGASIKLQSENISILWKISSLRPLFEEGFKTLKDFPANCEPKNVLDVANMKDGAERVSAVVRGLKVYADYCLKGELSSSLHQNKSPILHQDSPVRGPVLTHSLSQKTSVLQTVSEPIADTVTSKVKSTVSSLDLKKPFDIKLTDSDKALLKKLDMEHRAKLIKQAKREKELENKDQELRSCVDKTEQKEDDVLSQVTAVPKAVPHSKAKQKLNENAKQRKVPSSRIGRMVSFGTLAAGLSLGTAAEYAKRAFGIGNEPADASTLFMNKANLERITDTLCKVRGAALKLGQIMSIQDESIINPELAKALERVRKSADFMPDWQVEQVMSGELGPDWKKLFSEFEMRPFAAASIGQVHCGKLNDGREVAIKIQYPGVAKGIESDIDNLGGIMKMWNIFPKGMFLENLMAVAKRELAWEVDYDREAECTRKFKKVLANYNDFYVPEVIGEVSTKQVFTTELLDGLPVDQCFDLEYEHREFIGDRIMDLCLREILEFRYMQTDPNWANFLYSPTKRQLLLLDFGASREYPREFMDRYVQILKAACDDDRQTVLTVSKELGFLTGYESKLMEDAHVDAVMILGEIFRKDGNYDFAHQDMTQRIQYLAQIMLTHRLCPPPEEVYSLHRKLSGVFLLLSKLRVQINCREKFLKLYNNYVTKKS